MDLNASNDDRVNDNDALPATLPESRIHEVFGLNRIIVRDASGTLFEAQKTIKGRRVAVSMLAPGFSVVSKTLSSVEHNNICKTHQIIQRIDGQEAVVMDLPLGVPLTTLLETGTIFSINQAISILLQLLSAMHAVHKKDESLITLTENNIFIAEDSKGSLHLKLIGCGVGASGMDFRSPYYLSPEQIVDGNMRSPKSDLWAAGAVFFNLIFGHPPFEGEHAYDVAQKVMLEEPAYENQIRQVPSLVSDVLKKFLNKDTEQRFQSVAEAIAALLPLKAKFSDTAIPPQLPDLAYAATDPPGSPFDEIGGDELDASDAIVSHKDPDDDTTQNLAIDSANDLSSPALDRTVYATDTNSEGVPSSDFIEENFLVSFSAMNDIPDASLASCCDNNQNTTDPSSSYRNIDRSIEDSATDKSAEDLDTLINQDKSPEVMAQTKIDELAQANQEAPLSIDAIAEKLKQTAVTNIPSRQVPKADLKTTSKPAGKSSWITEFIAEQPKLFTALLVFTIATISFAIMLIFLLQSQGIRSHQPQPGTLQTHADRPSEENRPAARNPSKPPPVFIDLLRLPAGATVLLNDQPSEVPIRVPRSRIAIKLTVEAKGFKPFERLIVPDRDRKIMVEMPRRHRKGQ